MTPCARIRGLVSFGLVLGSLAVLRLDGAETRVTQLSQYGITWTFEQPVLAGQFVNGDWWVVGPVTVTHVDPAPGPASADTHIDAPKNRWGDTSLSNDNRMRNGSMIVLTPGGSQGYDSRSSYDPALSVTFPCTLEPNRSLISSISNPTLPVENFPRLIMWPNEKTCESILKTAAVLTVLDTPAPTDAFRPPYAGTNKPIYRSSALRWELLRALPAPDVDEKAYTPAYELRLPQDWEQMERYFERPWLDHILSWTQQQINPTENVPNYGREHGRLVSLAGLMLHLDAARERKEKLLIGLVQFGIDTAGLAELGASWNRGGGHTSGRKWPVVFASLMLDAPELLAAAHRSVFHEDAQTYYGTGWFGQSALWWMVDHHGPRERYEEKPPEQWERWDGISEEYRISSTVQSWIGSSLAALLMGARPAWNHDAFFDYCDRWMEASDSHAVLRAPHQRPAQEGRTYDPFVDAMWHAHRDAAPEQPLAGNPRMWVREGRVAHWVPNPKPSAEAVAAHAAAIHDAREAATREQEAQALERERQATARYGAAVAKQYEEAKAAGVPATYRVQIEAEAFSAQGGGAVKVTAKPGASGQAIMQWDESSHWLEYPFEIAQDGCYEIVLRYARGDGGSGVRALQIDGGSPCEFATAMELPRTGGWAAWELECLRWPDFAHKPYLVPLKAGTHTLRLENISGGGVNLDWIAVTAPTHEE